MTDIQMTDDRFWSLIDQARAGSSASATPQAMKAVLTPLSDEEVSDFGAKFYIKLCDLNSWTLWGAGYVIAGGMSDDSFHYFRSWIVGRGREVFELALTNPDALGPFIDDPEVENELLEYVTIEIFKERGSNEDPRDRHTESFPDDDPSGEPFDEETVAATFPRLAAQFG